MKIRKHFPTLLLAGVGQLSAAQPETRALVIHLV